MERGPLARIMIMSGPEARAPSEDDSIFSARPKQSINPNWT
jgi:hypothetical protein